MVANSVRPSRLPPDTYPAPETRWELVAVLSELRFLEGFLTSVRAAKTKSSLPAKVEKLCDFAGGLAYEIGEIGRGLVARALTQVFRQGMQLAEFNYAPDNRQFIFLARALGCRFGPKLGYASIACSNDRVRPRGRDSSRDEA